MINKFNILKSFYKAKKNSKFSSRDDLLIWQDKKVHAFLQKILSKSNFYKQYFKNYDLENWQKLPFINKKIMMDNFDNLNTVNITKKDAFNTAIKAESTRDFSPVINNITIGLSSGTSGSRGLFLVSAKERALWAGNILYKAL